MVALTSSPPPWVGFHGRAASFDRPDVGIWPAIAPSSSASARFRHPVERTARVCRGLAAVAAALPLLVLVAGCGGSGQAITTDTSTARRTTTARTTTAASTRTTAAPASAHEFPELRIAMDEATDYLDPGLTYGPEAENIIWNVYLPLLGYRHVNGAGGATIVPYLAKGMPTVTDGGRKYTLVLRNGLKYSNGQPVKAKLQLADAVQHWVGSFYPGQISDIYQEIAQAKPRGEITGGK